MSSILGLLKGPIGGLILDAILVKLFGKDRPLNVGGKTDDGRVVVGGTMLVIPSATDEQYGTMEWTFTYTDSEGNVHEVDAERGVYGEPEVATITIDGANVDEPDIDIDVSIRRKYVRVNARIEWTDEDGEDAFIVVRCKVHYSDLIR